MLKFNIINAAHRIVNNDGTPTQEFYSFCRSLWNNLGGSDNLDLSEKITATATQAGINKQNIEQINNTMLGYGNIVTHNASEFVAYPSVKPSKITKPTGGSTQDGEARDAIDAVIDVLETYGLTLNN